MAEQKDRSAEPVERDRYNEPRPEQKSGEGQDAGQEYVEREQERLSEQEKAEQKKSS